jgi:hypothetical protein
MGRRLETLVKQRLHPVGVVSWVQTSHSEGVVFEGQSVRVAAAVVAAGSFHQQQVAAKMDA